MKFSDTVKLLGKPLALGKTQAARVKRLADILTEDVDHADEFHAALGGDTVLTKYASGSRPIGSDFASAIVGGEYGTYYPDGLIDKIGQLPDQVRRALADQVRSSVPFASADNIGDVLASQLTETLVAVLDDPVLKDATAQTQRESSQKAIRQRALPLLLQQAGSLCPMPGCSQTLFAIDDAGGQKVTGAVAIIDPQGDSGDLRNLIVLCSNCGEKFTGTNPAIIADLSGAKRQLEERQANARLIPTGLESQIRRVVAAVAAVQPDDQPSAENWNAYEVRRKITTARMLVTKVEGYVAVYFNYIESATKDLNQEGNLKFERIRRAFGTQYESLADSDQTQEQIFDSMVEWLISLTAGERTTCEALVSYFIQICEVFRADT